MRQLMTVVILLLFCAAAAASEGQQAEAEKSVFSGTFADSLWTVITFAVLLVVLGRFAWKPVLKGLKARQEHIEHEIQAAENAKNQARQMLEESRQKGHIIIDEATLQAQQKQKEIMEEAQRETALIRQRARDDIQHALTSASEQLWNQSAEMIMSVGTEVLGRMVTTEDNQRLISEAIEKIRASKVGTNK